MSLTNFSRRKFLITSATATGGLVLGLSFTNKEVAATSGPTKSNFMPEAFLQITPDNRVIFQLDKHEMGQGIHTALPTIICEELGIDPRKIEIRLSQVSEQFEGNVQMTGGSTSVSSKWTVLREAGAKARSMLLSGAAETWNVDPTECRIDDGVVWNGKQSLTFGEVAEIAAQQPIPDTVELKDHKDFQYVGKSIRRLDGIDKTIGTTEFGIDVSMPGLVNAVVLRNPHFNQEEFTYSAKEAEQSAGVIKIFKISNGLAVVADTYWHARKAANLVQIDWPNQLGPDLNSQSIRDERSKLAKTETGEELQTEGDSKAALKDLNKIIEATYEVPYLAHATMEPQNTTVDYSEEEVKVWSPTQFTDGTQAFVAEALDLPKERIKVYGTMMGGGFGRRAFPDFAVEAAEVSREIGRPVKVIWSREDDTRHDYYRPSTYNELRGGVDDLNRQRKLSG